MVKYATPFVNYRIWTLHFNLAWPCYGGFKPEAHEELAKWDDEHRKLLDEIAPEQFDVLHYAALAVLKKRY